jgi:2-oxo-4-hydroxy-4-carboxy--5-ureidoimidazoline (OHCU) decarboxylase
MSSLPPFESFRHGTKQTQDHVLEFLFEKSDALNSLIHSRVLPSHPTDYISLVQRTRNALGDLSVTNPSDPNIPLIIAAHPRLGASKVESASSQKEQESLKAANEQEAHQLKELNQQYEQVFPGLRYVVFVNGRSRTLVMENMKQRIARGDIAEEIREAFDAMCDIAFDRLQKIA